ncbi:hypothetical protein E2C01_072087 [Portunus trituberculatus]|uniref:Uncharacterized protein n=1 Tax=Portunus trituberculatus TaxID=210409 RepID=A0A5B7I6W2_PORTR|nr:hypothetical protein [Portunus trituberculatus]
MCDLFPFFFQLFFEADYNVATFKMEESIWEANATQAKASRLLTEARQVRRTVKCAVVVVTSDNPAFIDTFATFSLKYRLLGGSSKLIIFTRLEFQLVNQLIASRWTLSMMNTMVLNQEQNNPISFHGAVVNVTALPYTPHWLEEIEQDENFSTVKRYSGTDFFLLSSIASTLNFKINVIPTSSWDEVR